ncbi:hypothetical protein D3C86_1502500 [compost metagenome]
MHSAEIQTHAGEDLAVGAVHHVVGFLQGFLRSMERVGIFHQEFAGTHHAETRTNFVTELGLDLEEVQRQLFVGIQLVADQIRDDFFMRWAEHKRTFAAINKTQQFRAVLLPATTFYPQVSRLNHRHRHLDRAGVVHLFTHDVFDFFQDAQAGRQPGIQPRGQLADHPGAQHQLMADDFGVGRRLLQSGEQILASTHVVTVPFRRLDQAETSD